MDSDTDESIICVRRVANNRRLVIEDDSSSGDESKAGSVKIVGLNRVVQDNAKARTTQTVQPRNNDDDLFSESSGSLEAMLNNLSLMRSKMDETLINLVDDAETSDRSMCSDDESFDDHTIEEDEESEDASLFDPDSAWAFNKQDQEYFLSKQKAPHVSWPSLRVPAPLFKTLFPHQKVGVQWMAERHADNIGGILGDDMGMGKTYTTATTLGGLMRTRNIKNAVIVAPKSVLRSWEKELKRVVVKCVANVSIRVVESTLEEKVRRRALSAALECSPKQPHIIITTYGMVNNSQELFKSRVGHWDYVVLDEAHTVKNSKTQTSVACLSLASNPKTHRIMLSGTPLMNNPTELFCLLDWACSGRVLGDLKRFKKCYANPITAARDRDASLKDMEQGKRVADELHAIIKPYLLQRLKKDHLATLLPSKQEFVVWTHLSEMQREQYTDFVKNDEEIQEIMAGEKGKALQAITWLKKLCGSPLLVKDNDDWKSALTRMGVEEVVRQTPKLEVLLLVIPTLIGQGHRALIFSQSTKMLDIIQFVLRSKIGNRIARIDGSTKESDRQRNVDIFNDVSGRYDVMLLSTRAGGVGLTLTGADRVIVYDPDWTSALDAQAVDRVYRIGATKPIVVYRMISAGTVDEKIYERQVYKEGIKQAVLTEGSDCVERHFNLSELAQVFKLGAAGEAKFMKKVNKENEAAGVHTDWSIHNFLLSHPGVVGLSRHDALYTGVPLASQELNEVSVDEPVVLGRAQRVLQDSMPGDQRVPLKHTRTMLPHASVPFKGAQNSVEKLHSEQFNVNHGLNAENAPNTGFVTGATAFKTTGLDNEDGDSFESLLASTLKKASSLEKGGSPRKAHKVLLEFLECHEDALNYHDRARLHDQIVRLSPALHYFM
ncbi:hypothetical protein MPSEU_000347300 [Mayamaea pseudoterrestris]|nr:hypothetical protein MPSEU_000347300 [Mayamaea pseudoterrestris]